MKTLRALTLALAGTGLALLAACGGNGKIHKPLKPAAIYTFGDGIVDAGQNGKLFTINPAQADTPGDYSIPHHLALQYDLDLQPQSRGGTAYALGGSDTPATQAQIDSKIAAGDFSQDDLVLLSVGMEDLIQATQAVLDGSVSQSEAEAELIARAQDQAQQWQLLRTHGAQYIFFFPPYDLGNTPWMAKLKRSYAQAPEVYQQLDLAYSGAINTAAENFRNRHPKVLLKSPNFRFYMGAYTDPGDRDNEAGTTISDRSLCTPPADEDASLCTELTVAEPDSNKQNRYLFADNRHPMPHVLLLLARAAYNEMADLWTD